jgi:hypothetical protein
MLENINGMKWKKNGIVTEIAKINSLTTEMKKKKKTAQFKMNSANHDKITRRVIVSWATVKYRALLIIY